MIYSEIKNQLNNSQNIFLSIMEYVDLVFTPEFFNEFYYGEYEMIWNRKDTDCFRYKNGSIIHLVKNRGIR